MDKITFGLVIVILGGVSAVATAQLRTDRWLRLDGFLKHTAVGVSGVWGVNSADSIFYRSGTYNSETSPGSHWIWIDGSLKQITVGRDAVWGVDREDKIFFRAEISRSNHAGGAWEEIPGRLKHISVSLSNQVWGVNSNDDIFRRVGVVQAPVYNGNKRGTHWEHIPGKLKQISTGQSGVWGVNAANAVFYRDGTQFAGVTAGTGWTHIPGRNLKYISSGYYEVYGVDDNNDIFRRIGLSPQNALGTGWVQIDGKLKQIETMSRSLWGSNVDDNIFGRLIY